MFWWPQNFSIKWGQQGLKLQEISNNMSSAFLQAAETDSEWNSLFEAVMAPGKAPLEKELWLQEGFGSVNSQLMVWIHQVKAQFWLEGSKKQRGLQSQPMVLRAQLIEFWISLPMKVSCPHSEFFLDLTGISNLFSFTTEGPSLFLCHPLKELKMELKPSN